MQFTDSVKSLIREIQFVVQRAVVHLTHLRIDFQRNIRQYIKPKLRLCDGRCHSMLGNLYKQTCLIHSCCIDKTRIRYAVLMECEKLAIQITPLVKTHIECKHSFAKDTLLLCFNFTNFGDGMRLASFLKQKCKIRLTYAEKMECLRRGIESEIIYTKFWHKIRKMCKRRYRETIMVYWRKTSELVEKMWTDLRNKVQKEYGGNDPLMHIYLDLVHGQLQRYATRQYDKIAQTFYQRKLWPPDRQYMKFMRSSKDLEARTKWFEQMTDARDWPDDPDDGSLIITKFDIRRVASQIDPDTLPSIDQYKFSNCELISRIYTVNPNHWDYVQDFDYPGVEYGCLPACY